MHTQFQQAAAQKRAHDFSNNELFSFCGNTLTNFEITLWTKTIKNRLSRKCLKRTKMRPRIFGVLVICISVRKSIVNHIYVGAGARKVENLVRFLSSFDLYFPSIQRVRKRCKINIYWKYWNIESIENMEVTTLESSTLPFHFAWRVLWDLIIQFRSTILLNDKSIWS